MRTSSTTCEVFALCAAGAFVFGFVLYYGLIFGGFNFSPFSQTTYAELITPFDTAPPVDVNTCPCAIGDRRQIPSYACGLQSPRSRWMAPPPSPVVAFLDLFVLRRQYIAFSQHRVDADRKIYCLLTADSANDFAPSREFNSRDEGKKPLDYAWLTFAMRLIRFVCLISQRRSTSQIWVQR